jgi:Flp pilus assembly protein TadD
MALIIYWPSLPGPFIWDDAEMLSSSVRSANGWEAIWRGNEVDYFPLTSTMFWVEWRLWGDSPAGYRIMNLALHAASATLIFQILRKLKLPGAGIAAGIFCVHPVCVGTVAWIAELKNTLSLFFALLTVFFFLRSRLELATPNPQSDSSISDGPRRAGKSGKPLKRLKLREGLSSTQLRQGVNKMGGGYLRKILPQSALGYYCLALFCFLLALLSKISVVTLPFVLAAFVYRRRRVEPDRVFAGALDGCRRAVTALLYVAPFFGLSLILGLINMWFQRHHAMAFAMASDIEPLITRLLGGGYSVWFYLWKALLPFNLMPIYPRWGINAASYLDWLPGLLWIAVLWVCWQLSKARRLGSSMPDPEFFRLALFCLSVFWLTLLPVLGVVQIVYLTISRVADHLQYLSLIGIVAMVGIGLRRLFRSQSEVRSALMAAPLVAALGVASFQRAQLFGDPERLWRDNIGKNPNAALAWANLAGMVAAKGNLDEALIDYRQSLKLEAGDMIVRENFGKTLILAGRYDEAIVEYRQLLGRKPDNARLHTNLGTALARKGLLDEAMREFKTALELNPNFPDAHKNLGAFFYVNGRYDEAIEQFEEVLRINPNFPGARQALLDAQRRKGAATDRKLL